MLHHMRALLFGVSLLGVNQIITLMGLSLDRLHLIDRAHLLKFRRLVLDGSVVQMAACTLGHKVPTKERGLFLD